MVKTSDLILVGGIAVLGFLAYKGINNIGAGLAAAPSQFIESTSREVYNLTEGFKEQGAKNFYEGSTYITYPAEQVFKGLAENILIPLAPSEPTNPVLKIAGSSAIQSFATTATITPAFAPFLPFNFGSMAALTSAPALMGFAEIAKMFFNPAAQATTNTISPAEAINQGNFLIGQTKYLIGTEDREATYKAYLASGNRITQPLPQTQTLTITNIASSTPPCVSSGGSSSGSSNSGISATGSQSIAQNQSYTGSGQNWTPRQIASGYSTSAGAIAGTG